MEFLEELRLDGKKVLTWMLKNAVQECRFDLFNAESSDGVLYARRWNFGLQKEWAVSWKSEQLSTSQKGLQCLMN